MFIYGKYRYENALKSLVAFNYEQIILCFNEIQNHIDSKKSGYFVGYLTYECSIVMQGYLHKNHKLFEIAKNIESKRVDFKKDSKDSMESKSPDSVNFIESKKPLMYFTLFKSRKKCKIPSYTDSNISLFEVLEPLNKQNYNYIFSKVKEHIANGNSYEVNLTQEIKLKKRVNISSLRYFFALCNSQNTKFKAFIKNEFEEILCFSPELFFKLNFKKNKIKLEPMKGTISRVLNDKKQDKKNKKWLKQDSKNQSENVMIVDLVRNDLSKIAKKVKVKKLFKVRTYPTLHQMVSKISATLPKDSIESKNAIKCSLLDIFNALFPQGSITGAPKLETMKIIYELENRARGVYCGTLGVISCKKANFCIPIRTLFSYAKEDFYHYGVGSGIVWESNADSEFSELNLKTKFLRI